jgi:hypothetical protein
VIAVVADLEHEAAGVRIGAGRHAQPERPLVSVVARLTILPPLIAPFLMFDGPMPQAHFDAAAHREDVVITRLTRATTALARRSRGESEARRPLGARPAH